VEGELEKREARGVGGVPRALPWKVRNHGPQLAGKGKGGAVGEGGAVGQCRYGIG